MIFVRRIYEPATSQDGRRFLVDRLWPRGVSKEKAHLDDWLKEVAPSDPLRRWFAHDASKWEEFQKRYAAELRKRPGVWKPLAVAAQRGNVTLLFAARDPQHNNATALKAFLEKTRRTGSLPRNRRTRAK
jgi:uncharacterized protein YeaO (DUF488 family)